MNDAVEQDVETTTARSFLTGLRLAAVVIAVVVLCTLGLPSLIRNLHTYRSATVQLACFAVYLGVALFAGAQILRGRSWGRNRWVVLAAVVTAAAAAKVTLAEGAAITSADWSFGAVGWLGVIVLTDRSLATITAFLAAHEVSSLVDLLMSATVTRNSILWLATSSIGCIGYPLAGAVAISALRLVAGSAEDAAREAEEARSAEAVAAGLHELRRQRFASLDQTTVPLLQGLSTGSMDPADERVQRRCAIGAARMRRLFAETDSVPNPLLHELRSCVEVADRRGILVEMEQRGRWPEPPLEIRRVLTEAPLSVLATAASWARVTVVGTTGVLSVNVVADCGRINLPRPAVSSGVRQRTVGQEDTLWVEVQWQTDPSRR